jgi:hypothetical protein
MKDKIPNIQEKEPIVKAWRISTLLQRRMEYREGENGEDKGLKEEYYGKRTVHEIIEDGFFTCSSDINRVLASLLKQEGVESSYVEAYSGDKGWDKHKHSSHLVLKLKTSNPIITAFSQQIKINNGNNTTISSQKIIEAENFQDRNIKDYNRLKEMKKKELDSKG